MKKDNYNLREYNTFGLEVQADHFVDYASEAELLSLIENGDLNGRLLHVGRGSNLLFLTPIFHGTVLHSRIRGIEIVREDDDHVWLRVGAGEVWDDFVDYCVNHSWYGAENLSLIPGEVGAAAVQNIGAYGVEAKDLITAVETISLDAEQHTYDVFECAYGYRDSLFKRADMKRIFITRVHFCLNKREHYHIDYGSIRQELQRYDKLSLSALREVIIRIRRSKLPDPKQLGNAGSFFKNPVVSRSQFEVLLDRYPQMPHYEVDADHVKIPAGWLIERSGWKGKSLGPAAVHHLQALVLVNTGGATGADILALSDAVRTSVFQQFGIEIRPEVNFIS